MIPRDAGWLVTPSAWPCVLCRAVVAAGRVRLLWAPGAPLCDRCVVELGLVDVLATAEGCQLLADRVQAGRWPMAEALAIAQCRQAADAWTLQRLRVALKAAP